MAKYPLAEDRKREVGAFLGHCVCRDLAAAAGAQWLLSGVQPSPCTAGSLGDGPAGHFARELLRAFLSALPKGSSFWRGLAIAFALALGECLLTGGTANLPQRLWSEFLPTLSRSALLTALAIHGGFLPALLYGVAAQAMGLWIPVSPALSRPMGALLELVMNLMFLVALDCDLSPDEAPAKRRSKASVAGGVAACTVLAALICFFAGLLPWQPVAVATGSMEPQISAHWRLGM